MNGNNQAIVLLLLMVLAILSMAIILSTLMYVRYNTARINELEQNLAYLKRRLE